MSNHTISTVATTEGDLPVFVFGKEQPELPLVTDPKVGDTVAVFSRGRYRAVQVTKVGPKRLTVAYTTQGALDDAVRVAQHNHVATHDRLKVAHQTNAERYRVEAEMIERLDITPTEDTKNPFVLIGSLPAEYARLRAQGGTNAADTTIVWKPSTLRKWAEDAVSSYTDEDRVKAEAKDAVPYSERVINATHVTSKSVKRSEVYAIS